MKSIFCACAILVGAIGFSSILEAGNWPGWRGPDFNGVASGEGYAVEWGPEQNVLWRVALPSKGSSTPAVWEDRIFITCGNEDENQVLCLDRAGKTLWDVALGTAKPGKNRKASGANPSPTTDGEHVFVYFKSGDLACLDFEGNIIWRKNLQDLYGEDTLWWDLGTSPVLTKDNVVVACMQTGPSYLAAFNKKTGEVAWKQDRNLGAPEEAAQSYTTPIVTTWEDQEILVVLGADHVTAHSAETGKELWRVGGLNPTGHKYFRSISSPVITNGIVIAPYARGGSLTAIQLGGAGDVTQSHVLWTDDKFSADVPTPAALDGRVYVCTDKGEVACIEAKTGKVIWSGHLEKNRNGYSSSPVLADGKIYVTREDGKTFVLATGEEFKVLAGNELGEETVATPVPVDGLILLRTNQSLFCIGKP